MQPGAPGKSVQLGIGIRLPLASLASAAARYFTWLFFEMHVSPPQFELRVMRAALGCTETATVLVSPWVVSRIVICTKPLGSAAVGTGTQFICASQSPAHTLPSEVTV